jgi:topoisomerase-4 subunit A
MHRALPDARDGLKPVHRRILYGMRLLRLDPGTTLKKSAKIVGDVMGNFHPHGDQAIYDAWCASRRMTARAYPLVDGRANSAISTAITGAMRYTEARHDRGRAPPARWHRRGRGRFPRRAMTVSRKEPVVLPAAFPNLLANGSQGHRGRHGDLDPAAQCGRAGRGRAAPDRQSKRAAQKTC